MGLDLKWLIFSIYCIYIYYFFYFFCGCLPVFMEGNILYAYIHTLYCPTNKIVSLNIIHTLFFSIKLLSGIRM